jgi:hypothetical protein
LLSFPSCTGKLSYYVSVSRRNMFTIDIYFERTLDYRLSRTSVKGGPPFHIRPL